MSGKSAGGSGVPSALAQQAAASDSSIAEWEHGLSGDQYGHDLGMQAGFDTNYGNTIKGTADSEASLQKLQTDWAVADRQRYDQNVAPAEQQYMQQAQNWASPQRQEQAASQASADVATQYESARESATSQLESFGIDPSQTRFGALDLGTRVSQAAASAGASTNARQAVQAAGMQYLGQGIQMGNAPNNSSTANASGAATSAGAAMGAVSGQTQASQVFGNLAGTGTQWAGQMNNTLGAQGQAIGTEANYQSSRNAQAQQAASSTGSTIGQLAGLATVAAIAL